MWGPKSQAALDGIVHGVEHHVRASSFADKADVIAFRKWFAIYKANGASDEEATKLAFGKGDNAIGAWDDPTDSPPPCCAIPPEDMIERWGSVDGAKHKLIEVTANDRTVICILKDRMPWRKNITNGAGIDLNPAACEALGLTPPVMTDAAWRWA